MTIKASSPTSIRNSVLLLSIKEVPGRAYAPFVNYKYARLHWSLLHLFQISSVMTFYGKISESWKNQNSFQI